MSATSPAIETEATPAKGKNRSKQEGKMREKRTQVLCNFGEKNYQDIIGVSIVLGVSPEEYIVEAAAKAAQADLTKFRNSRGGS